MRSAHITMRAPRGPPRRRCSTTRTSSTRSPLLGRYPRRSQPLDEAGDLVADLAHDLDPQPHRVEDLPVDVALLRQDGTRVAAAHRHDDVSPLDVLIDELVRNTPAEVDPELPHDLDHLGMKVRLGT